MDSKTEFLPWEVLFDSLRSATLNPFVLQSLSAKLLGISSCGEDKEVLILAQQIISFFNSLRIFFRFCTCRYQFNVVTALVYRVLNPLAIGNEVQFEPGTRTKVEGDQVHKHIFQFRG